MATNNEQMSDFSKIHSRALSDVELRVASDKMNYLHIIASMSEVQSAIGRLEVFIPKREVPF